MPRRPEPDPFSRIPTVFEAGAHKIGVGLEGDWAWSCKVDGVPLERRFQSQVEAWEAGVREADRLDREAGRN
jgi:hypothetical protein